MLGKLSKRFKFSTMHFAVLLISIQYCFAAPVENIYAKFINDLNSNECVTPEQIKLPSNSSAENSELLSSSLKICQNLDTASRIKEAQYLCREIFDNLKVVLCPTSKGIIKPLNITFSKQVCKDIASLKNVSENTFLLKHLTDNWSCEMLCDAVFEKACQVLHWSYQEKKDFEEIENIDKVNTGKPIQESILDSGKQKSQEPNKAKENVQKTDEMAQKQTKDTMQQPTNTFVLDTQKINSPLEHHAQNQVDKLQPNANSVVNSLIHITQKDVGTNSILSVLQKEEKNMSLNIAPQEDVINNNLPVKEIAGNNAVLPEIEEPHDNEGIFPHDLDPDVNFNKELPQAPINNLLPSAPAKIRLPNIPTNVGVLNLPVSNELHPFPVNDLPPANEGLPQLNPNDGIEDPHDGEELGEEENQSTNPKAQGPETTVRQSQTIEIANQNETNAPTQAKPTTIQTGSSTTRAASSEGLSSTIKAASSTTKAASSTGSTKSSTTATEKKAIEVKSSSTGKVSSVSADGKQPESLTLLPSLKDVSSSVVPSIGEDLSPAVPNIEKMEGEEDAHEMPEDREPDQYKTKPEKSNDVEVPKVDVGDDKEPAFEEIPPRSKYGPDDVPLIPVVFPEQEEGHFFFYFLSMVLIIMAGYLIFHNKQKIIALIVEGRHERRRRSHGAGYKKLETK